LRRPFVCLLRTGDDCAVQLADRSLLGVGIYTVTDAARITRVPPARIRRWLRGHEYVYRGERRSSKPVILGQLPVIEDQVSLGFRDLIELLVIDGFLREGVKWKLIHAAHQGARHILCTDHPFCDYRFKTDGRQILLDASEQTGNRELLNVVTDQYSWRKIVDPYLRASLDFLGNNVALWWPMGRKRRVTINPARMFGKPTVTEGVPTATLGRAYAAEHSFAKVAWWYEVAVRSVRDAVAYEQRLAA